MELYAHAYQQLATVSALIGGLAFTAASALLALGAGSKDENVLDNAAKITIALAICSSVILVCAALMWSFMAADIFRSTADIGGGETLKDLNKYPSIAMILGSGLFFASLGASGWVASKTLGYITSLSASLGFIALVLLIVNFSK
ncbi:hypothetical protein [Glaciecola sp. 1036]|uniref:hypothetical protein n=1 Tax=Alteromonadaceae TaxID=72275 RepID=UPI003D060A9E